MDFPNIKILLHRKANSRFRKDSALVILSIIVQLILGGLFSHYYDMPIFMATGYLVNGGQNPYISQDLTAVFHNSTFQGMTSVGYPPPWPLLLGFLFRILYHWLPNLAIYNLVIKLPVIAANIGLAFWVVRSLNHLGVEEARIRKAFLFMLFCPLTLYFGAAWGQFDSIVALLALISLSNLEAGRLPQSAALLALAIASKPTAIPLIPVFLIYLLGRSPRRTLEYGLWLMMGTACFAIIPFLVLGWDLSPILQGWNAHFTVAGGMSYMTFWELLKNTYQLPGVWWLLGLAWIPALGIAVYILRHGIIDFTDLLRKSLGMVLVFYLTRTWLSEPNIILLLPLMLILTLNGEFHPFLFYTIIFLPLVVTIFNASPPQLLWLNFPAAMVEIQNWAEGLRTLRLIGRTILVIPWQIAGWMIVYKCFKNLPSGSNERVTAFLTQQA